MKSVPSPQPAPASSRPFKDAIYEQFARIGKALASPKRLELLDLLCQGPRTVEVLADQASLSLANASQHLSVLRAARLIQAEKRGLFVTVRLAEGVEGFYLSLRHLAESRLAEVEATTRAFLEARGAMESVNSAELLARALSGEVTVLDVRPVEEYRAGHLPNARSVPLAELRARLDELPRDREVVAYCRGPYCVLAIEAVRLLREEGFVALRLDTGPPDWRAAGVPVEAS